MSFNPGALSFSAVRILVVEDDLRTRGLLTNGLTESGHECVPASNGREALELLSAKRGHFDLVLLDVMMPVCDGWQALEEMRAEGHQTPVVMLTARHEVHERVQGLKAGADDYLIKPFAWVELLARIEAVGRRAQRVLRRGDLDIDLDERVVRCAGQRIELSPREFALLTCLARQPETVVSRKQLLDQVWGIEFDPGSNVVDVTVSRLRRRLMRSRSITLDSTAGKGYALRVKLETAPEES